MSAPVRILFVVSCCYAGKDLALKELKGSAAAGGDVAHLDFVPFARIGFSNTPIGPFQTTVLAFAIASL